MAFIITCEHGSSDLPEWLASSFANHAQSTPLKRENANVCDDFDLGALEAATHFSRLMKCPLISAKYSPAVVDVNRSINQRGVFSNVTRDLPKRQKERVVSEIHQPYRKEVESTVAKLMRKEDLVIHLSVHSFATFEPTQFASEGEDRATIARRTDLGLLYDPARKYELGLCLDWHEDMYYALPMLRVRRNYPGRGVSESLIRSLRQKYSPDCYLGIELQLNRAWCVRDVPVRKRVFSGIAKSLLRICRGATEEQEAA